MIATVSLQLFVEGKPHVRASFSYRLDGPVLLASSCTEWGVRSGRCDPPLLVLLGGALVFSHVQTITGQENQVCQDFNHNHAQESWEKRIMTRENVIFRVRWVRKEFIAERNHSSVSGRKFWNVVEPYDKALKQTYKTALVLLQSSAQYNLKQGL